MLKRKAPFSDLSLIVEVSVTNDTGLGRLSDGSRSLSPPRCPIKAVIMRFLARSLKTEELGEIVRVHHVVPREFICD